MGDRVIGIDAGGTMTKAALFDLSGREVACARRRNVMQFPKEGHTERDPDAMWAAACAAIREILEVSGTDPGRIAAISAAGYGSGLYVLDRRGNPVRPGIVSTDSRATALVAGWAASGAAGRAGRLVQQRIWPAQSVSLLGWLAAEEAATLEAAHQISFCKDFLRGRLSGDFSTDPSDAGVAGLIDVTTGSYSDEMLGVLGLTRWRHLMPAIGPADAVVGGVTPAAAALTGLLAGTPVVRGAYDVNASALASGVARADQMSVVAGTFSINSTLHAAPRMDALPFLQSAYPLGGYIATEASATSASNLEWVCSTLLGAEAARAAAAGRTIYDVVNEGVASALDHPSDIVFLPFLFGGPGGVPAGFVGLKAGHGFGDVMRAVFEGIVCAHMADVELLLSGRDAAHPREVRLAGGASRSAVWGQMFADAFGMPVEVPESSELGALGVAILAAKAIGAFPDLASAQAGMARMARRFEPDAARTEGWRRRYRRYSATVAALAAAAAA